MQKTRPTDPPRDERGLRTDIFEAPRSRCSRRAERAARALRIGAVMMLACAVTFGCKSMSYDDPDAPPSLPEASSASAPVSKTAPETWSTHANAARAALRRGELDEAEAEFIACMAATEGFGQRDVRRLTSLAIPSRLAERYQRNEEWEAAARITDAVLAESQGGIAFPLDAWSPALQTRLEIDRLQKGPAAELALARQIADIHLGPIGGATLSEVTLRQRVGRLLGMNGDFESAATQLGWAARAAELELRLGLDERLGLLYEAADLSLRAGDPTTADFLLREAIELAGRSAPGGLDEANALNQRGWFLIEQDRPHVALPLLERAAQIVRGQGASPGLKAATLDSYALALHRADRLEEASAVLDEALAARAIAAPEARPALSVLDDHRAALDRDLSALELAPPAASADEVAPEAATHGDEAAQEAAAETNVGS